VSVTSSQNSLHTLHTGTFNVIIQSHHFRFLYIYVEGIPGKNVPAHAAVWHIQTLRHRNAGVKNVMFLTIYTSCQE